ncbi:NAD(P)H-binding protein [Companilactobacillus formosensis]|uniref:NAD(P)H-binding protein n=1 Tax=Companilactobacillus formosensis TaxID=1617889 RepID=UPI000E64A820|nr:NAD(P)H-binding protein [Companilactobacillus formosensis]
MKNILIIGANGRIAQLVEKQLLLNLSDIHLTLFLRNSQRLNNLVNNPQITLVEGDANDYQQISSAMEGQNIVYIAMVDRSTENRISQNVIRAMKANNVPRVIATNILGLYNELPAEFSQNVMSELENWYGLDLARQEDQLFEKSSLDYTTLRLPYLNDHQNNNYQITRQHDAWLGTSGSRESVASVITAIIEDPKLYERESIGISDPATNGMSRPVY